MKLIPILFLIMGVVHGCKETPNPKTISPIDSLSASISKLQDNVNNVKAKFENYSTLNNITDSTLKVLLIQYYKAGWMDGSNGVIDLHNANTLTEKSLSRKQKTDWRKMEYQINSK